MYTVGVCVCEGHDGDGGAEGSPDPVPPNTRVDLRQVPGPGAVRPVSGSMCVVPAVQELSHQDDAAVLCLMCRTQQVVKGETH